MGSFSLDSCRIQTVCLIYRQRLDCLHSSSLLFGLLAVSRRSCTILFSFFVFSPRLPVSRFSFLVPRFQFIVSVRCLPVSRSSFVVLSSIPQRYCRSRFIRFSCLLVFRPLAPPSLFSSVPPFLDVFTFTSC